MSKDYISFDLEFVRKIAFSGHYFAKLHPNYTKRHFISGMSTFCVYLVSNWRFGQFWSNLAETSSKIDNLGISECRWIRTGRTTCRLVTGKPVPHVEWGGGWCLQNAGVLNWKKKTVLGRKKNLRSPLVKDFSVLTLVENMVWFPTIKVLFVF